MIAKLIDRTFLKMCFSTVRVIFLLPITNNRISGVQSNNTVCLIVMLNEKQYHFIASLKIG